MRAACAWWCCMPIEHGSAMQCSVQYTLESRPASVRFAAHTHKKTYTHLLNIHLRGNFFNESQIGSNIWIPGVSAEWSLPFCENGRAHIRLSRFVWPILIDLNLHVSAMHAARRFSHVYSTYVHRVYRWLNCTPRRHQVSIIMLHIMLIDLQ